MAYFKDYFEVPKLNHFNFCNWYTFMTYTTPLVLDSKDITLSEFFNSYDEFSTFGLNAVFRMNGQFIQSNYTPTLSSLYLELESNDIIPSTDTTLDNSLISQISEEMNIYRGRNFIQYTEDRPHHMRPIMKNKIEDLCKQFEMDEISLNQLSQNSWYSVLWTSQKLNSSFTVFYKIRGNVFTNCVKFIPVIGCIVERTIDEAFWLTNQATNLNYMEDFLRNKQMLGLYQVNIFNPGKCF
jgi:hypothetical protein